MLKAIDSTIVGDDFIFKIRAQAGEYRRNSFRKSCAVYDAERECEARDAGRLETFHVLDELVELGFGCTELGLRFLLNAEIRDEY